MKMLRVVPITQEEARLFIARHRHLDRPEGAIVCCAIEEDGELVGTATLGRPVSPKTAKDRAVAEITRTCVIPGVRNGNSKLYAALRDVARALGYWKVQTFTLQSESGASLRGAGFVLERPAAKDKARPKGAWGRSRPGRSANLFGEPEISTEPKNRWVCLLGPEPSHVDARQAVAR